MTVQNPLGRTHERDSRKNPDIGQTFCPVPSGQTVWHASQKVFMSSISHLGEATLTRCYSRRKSGGSSGWALLFLWTSTQN